MANTKLTQTGAQVQADLDKVEELANVKTIGSGLSLSVGGELSASGGSSYTAGTGIDITGTTISVDSNTVAMQSDLPVGDIDMNINDTTTTVTTTTTLDNIVIGNSNDGYTKYTVSGGGTPSNMVTTDTAQSISGNKTFNGNAVFQGEFAVDVQGDISIETYNGNIKFNTASSNPYGLVAPNTGSWLTDKTIATTDDVSALNPMTTSQDIIVGGSSGTPTRLAKGSNLELLGVNSSGNLAYTKQLPVITTAPTSANTDGGLIIVVLPSDSGITKYDGYLYVITGS